MLNYLELSKYVPHLANTNMTINTQIIEFAKLKLNFVPIMY